MDHESVIRILLLLLAS